ncbi:MAG TPA: hypothetical protein VFN01_00125 [Marinobacter sp.]|nr:hypothetical protein [Marinobacter sp.]HET8799563.1 hypothetical protein [Marinobacter sp.]
MKQALLRLMAGVEQPDAGTIILAGDDLMAVNTADVEGDPVDACLDLY